MPEILEHFQAGNLNSKNMVVFLQGWPDNSVLWEWINWKEDLSDQHLLFINFPNTNGKVDLPWGKDFPELVDDLKLTIDSISEQKKKMLVAHDWGCFYSYLFDQKYPEYFSQILVMDVPGITQVKKINQILFILSYQFYLAFAFLIGGKIGKFMTQKLVEIFDHHPPYFNAINSSQNYPYYYFWRRKLLSALKLKTPYLPRYRPSVPMVYIYGTEKKFQFQGPKWMALLEEDKDRNQVHGLQDKHWMMKKYAKFITDLIQRRLKMKF